MAVPCVARCSWAVFNLWLLRHNIVYFVLDTTEFVSTVLVSYSILVCNARVALAKNKKNKK